MTNCLQSGVSAAPYLFCEREVDADDDRYAAGSVPLKLLVVEDDDTLRDVLIRTFEADGHSVDSAADGIAGEALCDDRSYDAIVLDVMLPGRDGLQIVRAARLRGLKTPVLMLTARSEESDTIAGLDAGADDYLKKPFGVAELQARLRSLHRRDKRIARSADSCGGITHNPLMRRADRNGRALDLSRRESDLLAFLLKHTGRAVSRGAITEALWPAPAFVESNVIEVLVGRLRAKLHAAGEAPVLHTVRGIGYRLSER